LPLPATLTVLSNTAVPEQLAAAVGPYKLNVIVPVGDEPPDKAAVSRTVLPTGPPGLGVVAMTGEDFGALAPRRVRLAAAAGLLLVPVSVAVSFWPPVAGA